MRTPTLVGARVPRARRHPTPARGSVVGRPAAPRAGGGPPGTSAPTILPPAPTWPLPLSHPHPLGPYHCPTRTHLAPTIVPPAPTSAPTIVPPAPTSASTILPPAPTWPLPLSHPHPLGPYHCPTRTHLTPTILPPAPTWPLPFSRPHPLGPDVGSTTGPVREVPAPPSARGVHSLPPHASTPCASRAPRNSPQKSDFFCHRRMPTAYIHVSGFARICAAPNKTRGIRRFGRRVRRVYFFFAAPLRARRLCGILMASLTMEEDSDGMSGPGLTPGVSRNGPQKWKRAQQVNH